MPHKPSQWETSPSTVAEQIIPCSCELSHRGAVFSQAGISTTGSFPMAKSTSLGRSCRVLHEKTSSRSAPSPCSRYGSGETTARLCDDLHDCVPQRFQRRFFTKCVGAPSSKGEDYKYVFRISNYHAHTLCILLFSFKWTGYLLHDNIGGYLYRFITTKNHSQRYQRVGQRS